MVPRARGGARGSHEKFFDGDRRQAFWRGIGDSNVAPAALPHVDRIRGPICPMLRSRARAWRPSYEFNRRAVLELRPKAKRDTHRGELQGTAPQTRDWFSLFSRLEGYIKKYGRTS